MNPAMFKTPCIAVVEKCFIWGGRLGPKTYLKPIQRSMMKGFFCEKRQQLKAAT